MQAELVVADREAAAVFANMRQRAIVQTLIHKALTLSALGRATQTPLNLLHYHVAKLTRLGLVVRIAARAGRRGTTYRAAAETFFVPAELIVEMPGTGLTQALRERLDQGLARSLRGVRFTHDGQGPRAHLVEDAAERAALELWLDVGLAKADLDELKTALQAIMDRFRKREDKTEARYLVHVATVRL